MHLRHTTLAALLAAASLPAIAAPHASTYVGRVGSSTLAGVGFDEPYSVTLIMDNGGTSAASQTWDAVGCVIWRIGAGRVYTQALGSAAAIGTATTQADGSLSGFFSSVTGTGDGIGSASNYTATGFSPALAIPIVWQANEQAPVFIDIAGQGFADGDTGGIVTAAAAGRWSAPRRVTAACDDTPYADAPAATPVPALGHGALALLGASLAGLAAWRRRHV